MSLNNKPYNYNSIISFDEDKYFATEGANNRWIGNETIQLFLPDIPFTYCAFDEIIKSLEIQHEEFLNLQEIHKGDISMAYGSIAANILITLSLIKHLFNIFEKEHMLVTTNEFQLHQT